MRSAGDLTLPGVQAALHLESLLPRLNRAFREHREPIEAIGGKVVDVQYKPGRTCLIMYRLRVLDHRTGRAARRLFSAEVRDSREPLSALPAETLALFANQRKRIVATPEFHLTDIGAIVRPFPLDLAMPWLVEAVDASAMKRHLNEVWRLRKLRVRRLSHQVLGYTPAARATFAYRVVTEHPETGETGLCRVIGKTHFYKAPDRLFAHAWALWRAAGGRVRLAEPLGYIAPLRMTLQTEVQGRRLSDLAGTEPFVPLVRETARAIAIVHRLTFPLTTRRDLDSEVRVVHRWARVLAEISPSLAERIQHLQNRLADRLADWSVQSGPVHGDFHPANVLADAHGVTFIDLDEMAFGDPLLDVGRFLASLRVSALRVYGDPAGLADAEAAFLEDYLAEQPGMERRARLFEASSLLIAAATPFRLQREGWQQHAIQLVDEAERILATAEKLVPVEKPSQTSTALLPLEERLTWASDGTYVQAALDPFLRDAYGVDITECTPGRLRPSGRGYRLRYKVAGRRDGRKWRTSLLGLISREPSGRGLARRLETLRSALDGMPGAPRLPRPVAHMRELATLVVEGPSGTPLVALVGTADAQWAWARLGRALAVVHRSSVNLEKSHSLKDELRSVYGHVEPLRARHADLAGAARAILKAVEPRWRGVQEARVPVLRALPPRHLLVDGDHIGIDDLRDIVLGHPLIDVADVLARLARLGLRNGRAAEVEHLAAAFCQGYVAAGGADLTDLQSFEATALVREACQAAQSSSRGSTARHLVGRALHLLDLS